MQRLPNRAILSLTGPDTLALLERTVTHKVEAWETGEARYGALLTPQGKVIADYIAHRAADGVFIDVHEDAADDLLKRLKMFRLRSAVEITRDATRLSAAGEEGAPDPRSPALPRRAVMEAGAAPEVMTGWDALAIAAGIPEWGRDYRAAEVFPTDINMDLMNGVDYKKGCFVGQEVASRMKRKGLIRKRTLHLLGAGLETGADVRAGSAVIGAITSHSGGDGLALVRTDRLARAISVHEQVTVNDAPAEISGTAWLSAEIEAHLETPTHD